MKKYRILDITDDYYTYAGGRKVYSALVEDLTNNSQFELDFSGVTALPTSFLNGLLGSIIEAYDVTTVKRLCTIINITKAQSQMLKDYVANFTETHDD